MAISDMNDLKQIQSHIAGDEVVELPQFRHVVDSQESNERANQKSIEEMLLSQSYQVIQEEESIKEADKQDLSKTNSSGEKNKGVLILTANQSISFQIQPEMSINSHQQLKL